MYKNQSQVSPVFALFGARPAPHGYVSFHSNKYELGRHHGNFDPATGLYTVQTPGVYQFHFTGHAALGGSMIRGDRSARVGLKVNGVDRAAADTTNWGSLVISTLIRLEYGDQIGIHQNRDCYLSLDETDCQFIGIFLSSL